MVGSSRARASPPVLATQSACGLALADARQGLGGDQFNRLRTIYIRSALSRFHAYRARVVQSPSAALPDTTAAVNSIE
jgi:hypothetical protein